MGEGNTRICCDAERRGNAGHYFERNAGVRQGFGLLATATEEERIAAFQTDDVPAVLAPFDKQSADLLLRERVFGFLLADVDALCGCWRQVEQFGTGEVVVENAIRVFEKRNV